MSRGEKLTRKLVQLGFLDLAKVAEDALTDVRQEGIAIGRRQAWRHLDTAPKDRQIDLWVKVGPLARRIPDCLWRDGAWVALHGGRWKRVEHGGAVATHWMPAPDHPEDTDGQ